MNRSNRLFFVCSLTAAVSLALVGLGGYVRATNAGLACPDWPLCHSRVIPPFSEGVLQEFLHRVLAGFVLCLTAVLLWIAHVGRERNPYFWKTMVFLAVLVVVQAVMGGLTVIFKLNPFIVVSHLVLGTVYFQIIALSAIANTVFLRKAELPAVPALFYRVTYCLAAACFLQIALGGFVAASGASLACPDFPLCYGALLPLGYGPSAVVQMTHRGLGLVVLLLAAWACLLAPKDNASAYGLKRTAHGMFWLIVLQIAAGAGTVLMSVPVHLAVTHLLLAQIILLKALFLANCQNGIVRALAVPGAAAGLEHTFATDLMPPQEAA